MALADDDVHFQLDHVVPFNTFGDPVDVRLFIVDVRADVDLQGEIDYDPWMRLYDQGAFHLDDEDRPGGWDPDMPIQIRARLRSAFTRGHDDAEQWFELFMGDDNGPLRHSEAWLMTEATQAVPVPGDVDAFSSIGIRTRWAPSLLE